MVVLQVHIGILSLLLTCPFNVCVHLVYLLNAMLVIGISGYMLAVFTCGRVLRRRCTLTNLVVPCIVRKVVLTIRLGLFMKAIIAWPAVLFGLILSNPTFLIPLTALATRPTIVKLCFLEKPGMYLTTCPPTIPRNHRPPPLPPHVTCVTSLTAWTPLPQRPPVPTPATLNVVLEPFL